MIRRTCALKGRLTSRAHLVSYHSHLNCAGGGGGVLQLSTVYPRSVCPAGPGTAVLTVRWGTPPRHAVKNKRATFSHCNPVFPGKGPPEGDRFLDNYTALQCRSIGSGVPAAPAEQETLCSSWGLCGTLGETSRAAQWSLSCIIYLKYQTGLKRLVDWLV